MAKYSLKKSYNEILEKAKKICEVYAEGDLPIHECVKTEGISIRQFYNWAYESEEIAEIYNEAKKKARVVIRANLQKRCLNGLEKLLDGHFEEETTQVAVPSYDGKGQQIGAVIKEVRKQKKYYPPSSTAVIAILRALNPEFRDKYTEDVSTSQVFIIGGQEVKF